MAGDENADGRIDNPALFGSVDALMTTFSPNPLGLQNPRTVFWSVAAAMGTAVSASPFRPGDVARIVRNAAGQDGQVEHFMTREQFNTALGLPQATAIDVDAITFHPEFGVFFSLDADIVANTVCGPTLVRDGAVVVIPSTAITYTIDQRVAGVVASSAFVALSEAQIDQMVVAAGVADRNGLCVQSAGDLEALDFDWNGFRPWSGCPTAPTFFGPELVFAVENGTGASLLTTAGGGGIWNGPCAPMGQACAAGPTLGTQVGLSHPAPGLGVASYVNAFVQDYTNRYVLEAASPVMSVFPAGAPAGAAQVAIGGPFAFHFVFLELVSPVVPASFPAAPFSQEFFPDLYAPSLLLYTVAAAPTGFATVPTPAIPPGFTGKVLFQSAGFSATSIELSTPAVIDVQ
jgi:hypothetical protein